MDFYTGAYRRGIDVLGADKVYTDSVTVKQVQAALNKKGESLTVDGQIGPMTKKAVTKYNESRPSAVSNDGESITDGTLADLGIAKSSPVTSAVLSTTAALSSAKSTASDMTQKLQAVMPDIPMWQYAVAAVGALAIGFGLWKAVRK